MHIPAFFDTITPITMYDPLAQTLGAVTDGMIDYTYLDMVKLAGHSCPTVAGAWIMTAMGLSKLYGNETPIRGNVKIELHGAADEGVAGVIANCIGLVTGAAAETGFKGLSGQFARNERLFFNADITGEVRLSRINDGSSVTMSYDPSPIPPDAQMRPLMQKLLSNQASPDERLRFGQLWQARVERILTCSDTWEKLVHLH